MYHYYNFTFVDAASGGFKYGNCYIGFDDQRVSAPRIAEARALAKVSPGATLVDCSYLGQMSIEEFDSLR